MNLGIDARLFHEQTGIGRYTRSLFAEYVHLNSSSQDQIYLFHDTPSPLFEADELPDNVHLVTAQCKRRIVWTNWCLPPLLRQHQVDVYHGVCNFELPLRKVCRYVVTIHDLVPLFFPELVPKKHLLFFRLFMKRAAHTADVIITDSEHSKQDIVRYLQVSEKKVRVIYLGFTPPDPHKSVRLSLPPVLRRYHISRPYVLFVGVIEPKKNLERLVDAFARLRHRYAGGQALQLVLAGGKGWFSEQLYQKVRTLNLENHVLFTGFVPDDDLPCLYRGAELFVFPSIYEGFGLPVLEAMSYGTPVVTSLSSSLPEIAGNACMLVDPLNPDAIFQGMLAVLTDNVTRDNMRTAGPRQAQKFSWKRTAEHTYQVYREVCST